MDIQNRIHQLLSYDPNTGVFTWKISRRGRAKVGSVAGTRHPKGYIRISIDHIDYLAHRIAWMYVNGPIPNELVIDHINGDRSDNRIANLRVVTPLANSHNQQARLSGEYGRMVGASLHKPSGKWICRMKQQGREKYIGLFDTQLEAHEAYMREKKAFSLAENIK